MEEVIVGKNNDVKLFVKISSDAIVGSNVSLNKVNVRRSGQYNFSVALGNSTDLDNNELLLGCQFIVADNIDAIYENTIVTCVLKFGNVRKEFTCKKMRVNGFNNFFGAYFSVKLIKE